MPAVRFLQQLRTVQRCLRDQRVVIVLAEDLRALERAHEEHDRLQLRTRVRYAILIHSEGLHIENIGEVFETTFVGDLGGEEEESQHDGRSFDLGEED